jgi:hypothetical protein
MYGVMVLAILTFAAVAFAAAPDAGVKGLWLKATNFPADAELVEFNDDADIDIVDYIRALSDGSGVQFEIRRQPIEESELQTPEDVESLIEMQVYDEDGNTDAIEVDTEAKEFFEHFSYLCATASYVMGKNEDTRNFKTSNISMKYETRKP